MPSKTQFVEFTGRVIALEPMGARALRALLTHPDSRFVVIVRVLTVSRDQPNVRPGTDQIFAIHSPSRLFGSEDSTGGVFEFRLTGVSANGQMTWQLEVRR